MFSAIPTKVLMTFMTVIEKSTLQFICKLKRLWISKASLRQKSNAGGITKPDFKLYYRAIAIKTLWYWHQNRYENKWKRIEVPDIDPQRYDHLFFDKDTRNRMERRQSLQQMLVHKLDIYMQKTETTSIHVQFMLSTLYMYQLKVD
jgi:hypothetical protein